MSDTVKRINRYFKSAVKSDIDELLSKILLSERQEKIFEMYFIKALYGKKVAFYFNM